VGGQVSTVFRNNANSASRVTILDGGNVGIGETSPFSKLHVKDTGWSGSSAPYGTVQLIEGKFVVDQNWGHLVITDEETGSGQGGSLRFATGPDSSLNPFAGIQGVAEGTSYGGLGLYTRPNGGTATERMRIDSNGHTRFGPSGDGFDSAWAYGTYGNTEVAIDGTGGYGVLHLRGDGAYTTATRFSMGVGDQKFYMCYDDVDSRHNIIVDGDGHVSLAKNLKIAAGQGIDFSSAADTASGETTTSSILNDYEEGTFTPFITTAGGNYTSGSQSPFGYYTKIGRWVHLLIEVSISSSTTISGGSGEFRITGLPYDPLIAAVGNCSTGRVDKPTYGTWQAYLPQSYTYLVLRAISNYPTDSDGIETAQASFIHANATPWFSITISYQI